jgi:hypothetical protein
MKIKETAEAPRKSPCVCGGCRDSIVHPEKKRLYSLLKRRSPIELSLLEEELAPN